MSMEELAALKVALEKQLENNLKDLAEDNPSKFEDVKDCFSFYDLGITEGEPHAFGNATDCYDHGFDLGFLQGQLDILSKLFPTDGEITK